MMTIAPVGVRNVSSSRTSRKPASLISTGSNPSALGWVSWRSEEHTSELQSLMRISYAVFCLKKKKHQLKTNHEQTSINSSVATSSTASNRDHICKLSHTRV